MEGRSREAVLLKRQCTLYSVYINITQHVTTQFRSLVLQHKYFCLLLNYRGFLFLPVWEIHLLTLFTQTKNDFLSDLSGKDGSAQWLCKSTNGPNRILW